MLCEHLRRGPLPASLHSVLIHNDDEQARQQPQCNQVRPEVAVPYGFFDQQSAALIKTLPVVFVGRIDALQGEIDEAILLPWRLRLSGRIVAAWAKQSNGSMAKKRPATTTRDERLTSMSNGQFAWPSGQCDEQLRGP